MGESKIKDIRSIEGRAAIAEAGKRRSRIKDRFGRGLEVNDACILQGEQAQMAVWRVAQITPAVSVPQAPPGSMLVDFTSTTRVLFVPGMPSDYVTLVQPANNPEEEQPAVGGEAARTTPGGLILPGAES